MTYNQIIKQRPELKEEMEERIAIMMIDGNVPEANRAAGGQYNRSEKHSEMMSVIMKKVVNRHEYRKAQGWLSVEEREAKRLRGMRIYLINKLQMVRKIKLKEEKQAIADQHGFKNYNGYTSSLTIKQLNEYLKTPEGREAMSKIKAGVKHSGMGKYTNEQFDSLLSKHNLNNYQAAKLFNCSYDTVRLMRRGWIKRQGNIYPVYVKDEYYELCK